MNARAIFKLFSKTFEEWNQHKAPRLAAALAYYTVFSLSPLLIIIVAIAGLYFGQQAAQNQIVGQIQGLVGKQSASLIQTMMSSTYHPGTNIIATVIGVVTLLLGAIGVFGQLQDSLNTVWEVQPVASGGIMGMIRNRILSFGLLLATGFLLLVSLVLSAGLQATSQYFASALPIPPGTLEALNFVLSFLVITLLFAMIYKFLPDAEIHWRDVWHGAAFTALLFTIGKFLIGLYLGRSSVSSAYGAAGALVILLLWIYYSALILFFGAEFTRVYANTYGSKVEPEPGAAPATNPSESANQPTPKRGKAKAVVEPDLKAREQPQAGVPQGKQAPSASTRVSVPRGALALADRQLNEKSYERNMAALFGFLAGAVLGARVLGHAGQDGAQGGKHAKH